MHRHSIFCIVPPVVFERIARNGSHAQREAALDTLSRDNSLRAARLQNAVLRGDGALHADALATADPGKPKRTIYDAKGGENLPGEPVAHEGEAPSSSDPALKEAYDGLGETYDYYWKIHDRDSIDDAGMPLLGVIHYGQRYDNAFWDGQRMIFGDGDGEIFNRFTVSLDVIGHELTHGVTEDEAGLNYWQQSGALNESVSDIFGSMIKQHKLNQTAEEADWLIGAGLLAEGSTARRFARWPSPVPRTTTTFSARTRSRHTWTTTCRHLRQRRRAHQLGNPEPRLLPARHGARRLRLGEGRRHLVLGAQGSASAADRALQHVRADDRASSTAALRRRQRGSAGCRPRVGPGRRPDQPAGARRRTQLAGANKGGWP